MIEMRNITVEQGGRVIINRFSATIATASIAAIIGPNGAGKSTLLSAISGELKLSRGDILIDFKPVRDFSLAEISQRLSLAQQNHGYWMSYLVEEIIWLGHDTVSQDRFDFLASELQLEGFLQQPITDLSGGQLQRVEIARSLMRQTPIVLLDEPFASQDLESIQRITQLIKSERDQGRTFLIVTHSREDELQWCDHIINLGR